MATATQIEPESPHGGPEGDFNFKLKSPSFQLLTIHLANCQLAISYPAIMVENDLHKQFCNILQALCFVSVVNHGRPTLPNRPEDDQNLENRTGVLNAVASILVQDHEILAVTSTSSTRMEGIVSVSHGGKDEETDLEITEVDSDTEPVKYITERSIVGRGLQLTMIVPNPRDSDKHIQGAYIPDVEEDSNWDSVKTTDIYSRAAM
jgi:hypothetical protein